MRPQTPHRSPRQAFGGNSWNQTEDGRFGTIATKRQGLHARPRYQDSNVPPFAVTNGSKHGPTYRVRMEARSHRPPRKCEMNFRNNLTTFSWKALDLERPKLARLQGNLQPDLAFQPRVMAADSKEEREERRNALRTFRARHAHHCGSAPA